MEKKGEELKELMNFNMRGEDRSGTDFSNFFSLYWYSIYMTTEKRKGSNIFLKWSLIDEVKAFKLPMCVMITKYKQGHKLCVSLLGKDIFGRYGPFSDVVIVNIPE